MHTLLRELIAMNWLLVASITTAVTQVTAQQTPFPSGTCASIGYSTSCCPPDINCQAADGYCQCDESCHLYGDCCQDAHCSSRKYI